MQKSGSVNVTSQPPDFSPRQPKHTRIFGLVSGARNRSPAGSGHRQNHRPSRCFAKRAQPLLALTRARSRM